MAEAIVGPLLSKLQDVVITEAKALAAVGGEVEKLSDKLMWLQALVHETDLRSRHDGDRLVRVLTCQIRTVAFEAEDAVDEFYLKGDLFRRFGLAQRFGRNWVRAAVELVVNLPTHFCVRFSLSSRMQTMNARLEDIVNNSSKYGMRQGGRSSADGMTWRASRAVPIMRDNWENSVPFKLIGRNKEKKDLKLKLMHDPSGHVKVIRVVGPPGIGKRALLNYTYEDGTIKDHFQVLVRMSFPPGIIPDSSTLKKAMEENLDKACSWRNIPRRQDARCLVLLDGTSIGQSTWSKVEPELQQMVGKGSKILMTQASWHEEMNDCTIKLKHLHLADSKTLFNHVVGLQGKRKSAYATLTMNEIRDNIEVITHGLPLAVVLLAKFMSTVPYSKWKAASEYIKRNCEDDLVKTILSVCIDDLPDELKSCLLYTAGVPEKTPIDARELVRLWMAEGFLTQKQGLETEQLGQSYLKELVYRGLLQLIRKTSTADGGRVESVALPEQIHPLIRLEARRTSFMDVHYGGSVPPPANTRRLALLHMHSDKKFSAPSSCLDKLRTVVSYSDDDDCTDHEKGWNAADVDDENKPRRNENEPIIMAKLLRGSPFLRVVHLEEGLTHETQLPDEIGEMVHLQYLGIRCRSLKRVPSSIGNLGRLQTVDVRGTQVKELPTSLWKIRTLRHVLGDGLTFPRSTRDLKLMQTLETVTIQHFHISCMNIICKRRKNKFGLRFLHRLGVVHLDKNQRKDLENVLKELSYLESLSLSGDLIPIDLFADADAANCLDNVASMELDGKLPPLDDPCCDERLMRVTKRCLSNLTRLVLRRTNINQLYLNVISMLPILAELEMHEESYVGVQMDLCSQRFNSLLVLRITRLATLKRVTFPGAGVTTTRNEPIKPIFCDMQNIDCEAHVSCSFCNATGGGLADAGQHPQPQAAPNANGVLADVGHHPPPVPPNATRGLAGNEQSDTGGDATAQSPVLNYTEMILDAIKTLDQRGDKTNKTEIKKYIRDEGNYSNLPQGNELRKVINGNLGTMVESRVLIMSRRTNCYVISDARH